jgi:mono/diheme cytochrome c family protein
MSDMTRQPKYKPQASTPFFSDHRASRRPVEGTVAQSQLKDDPAFTTGLTGEMYLGRNPLPIDAPLLSRGQERFNIYCAPCHDQTGSGRGIVAVRSSWLPANLLEPRTRAMVDGELFNVMTYGRRSMPAYRFQVSERDRWAIVAYLRALQRSTAAKIGDVPEELQSDLR